MADFVSTSNIEKLNEDNYSDWSIRLKFDLRRQGLWELIEGNQTTPPPKGKEGDYSKWDMKAGKALSILALTVESKFLDKIKDASTPKEAWDALAERFAKTNEAKLQRLENELMSISQGEMSVSQYFTKVKSLCEKISKLDPIDEVKMRRIINRGLKK
jgi:DNA-directed RNA polymerase subunit F